MHSVVRCEPFKRNSQGYYIVYNQLFKYVKKLCMSWGFIAIMTWSGQRRLLGGYCRRVKPEEEWVKVRLIEKMRARAH